ncbi:hypothetical protein XBKB1_530008 [Xenorhabdus bovienii str. kraussei Becker Underwood]|uniref:Uncharacterized protein n=1 Tax=Xenorhabdus bovienii str. kraussei Becker Underwood TaxID=1398204 RepID=A0A077PZQ1_XENBV|nr:hypothetical protein XBKB1_530008 [Xenorhabdus bovienii str. kraussei Becker Underwood]
MINKTWSVRLTFQAMRVACIQLKTIKVTTTSVTASEKIPRYGYLPDDFQMELIIFMIYPEPCVQPIHHTNQNSD